MSYATPADLARNATVGQLAGLSPSDQQAALDDASSEFDGYARAQEVLPLATPYPRELVRHVCRHALYSLLSRRGFNPELDANKVLIADYERAITWFRQVARGEVSFASGSGSASRLGGARVATQPQRGWGRR